MVERGLFWQFKYIAFGENKEELCCGFLCQFKQLDSFFIGMTERFPYCRVNIFSIVTLWHFFDFSYFRRSFIFCMEYKIKLCGVEHLEGIRAILNGEIARSLSIYVEKPRTPQYMEEWFEGRMRGGFPVFGLFDVDGTLGGFASYGPFRNASGYAATAEHSIYLHPDFQGKGLGSLLLRTVMDHAKERGIHVLVAGIDSRNEKSIALHKKMGFSYCGTIREAACKFGTWLDLVFYQFVFESKK